MKGQLLPGIVENISTRKDRTVKIVFGTQELSPSDAGQLFNYMNKIVYIYIKEGSVDQNEVEQVDKLEPELNTKSQGQRIRNTLYILYTQGNEGFKTFDEYYKAKTEKYIEHLKSKII